MRATAPLLLAASLCVIGWSIESAAAQEMQPGRWRFTQQTQGNGKARAKATTRCVSPAQAKNPGQYFAPSGRGCALTSNTAWVGRLSSSLRCQQGDVTTDVSSTVTINSPTQMSVSTTMTMRSPKGSGTVTMVGSGVRVGNCRG
jgi:hypothetical protein